MHVISTAAPSSAISLRLCSPLRCSVRLPLYFSVSKLGFCRLVKKVEITFSGYNPDLTADPSRGMVDVSSSLPYISTFLCCSEIRIFCGYSQLHERRDRKRKKKKTDSHFQTTIWFMLAKGTGEDTAQYVLAPIKTVILCGYILQMISSNLCINE